MKNLILVLAILFTTHLQAAVISVDEVMAIIDNKQITNMEELLPELPYDLRSNFVAMFDSRSRQGASMEKPRIIMFGKDGKILMSFNGDSTHSNFNRLELIQFNEEKKNFEFFEIGFPIVRDSNGRAVRPDKNPSSCLRCHGADPHPIWNSYNNWPGAFGSGDDFLEGNELSAFENFLTARRSMDRYSALSPMTGSDLAPFSYEKRGNVQFRPNLRMGSHMSRLQAKHVAELVRASGRFEKYASLFAYNVDFGGGGAGFPGCENLTSARTTYGGQWSPALAKKLWETLENDRKTYFPSMPPIPEKWNFVNDLAYLFTKNPQYGHWSLDLEFGLTKTVEFQNGNAGLRAHVIDELQSELYQAIPELRSYGVERSRYEEDVRNQRLIRTPFDLEYLEILDAASKRLSFKSNGEHCPMLLEKIKKDWAL